MVISRSVGYTVISTGDHHKKDGEEASMKKIRQIIRGIKKRAAMKRREKKNTLYYDNYIMLGSILGSYSSMMRFGGKK